VYPRVLVGLSFANFFSKFLTCTDPLQCVYRARAYLIPAFLFLFLFIFIFITLALLFLFLFLFIFITLVFLFFIFISFGWSALQ